MIYISLLNYLVLQSFDIKRTWWRFLEKRVVGGTILDIYV